MRKNQLNMNKNKYRKCFGRGKMKDYGTHSRKYILGGDLGVGGQDQGNFIGNDFHTDTEGNNKMYWGFCMKKRNLKGAECDFYEFLGSISTPILRKPQSLTLIITVRQKLGQKLWTLTCPQFRI